MRRLISHIPTRGRRRAERGAVATIVAVLLAGGVLMGMAALSIDVGQITFERRQLQNGADSGSLAFADICASKASDCDPTNATTLATLKGLLNGNAADNASQLDASRSDSLNGLCGRATGGANVPNCASAATNASVTNLAECPPLPSWLATGTGVNIPYVEAYSLTQSSGGGSILPARFSQLITGQAGTSVRACARAAWGIPSTHTGTVPITFSACEWKRDTNNGTDYVTPGPSGAWPGYGPGLSPWPDPAKEITIILHDPSDETADCSWNGKDTSGGFGYLKSPTGTCSATVTSDNWAQIDTGNNVPTGCPDVLAGLRGTVVALPVFDCLIASQTQPVGPIPADANCDPTQRDTNGNNTWYHIAGWAQFYLTGYKLSGNGSTVAPSLLTGSVPCSGGSRCISGWYVKGSLDATAIVPPGGGTDFGTYAVLPAG